MLRILRLTLPLQSAYFAALFNRHKAVNDAGAAKNVVQFILAQ
jgi:hypothetical protein